MPSFPHGGHCGALARKAGRAQDDILDFSANINPLGPPDWLRPVILGALSSITRYPDPDCAALLTAASSRYGLPPSRLAAGNGASDLLFALPRASGLTRAALLAPCYVDYETACRKAGLDVAVRALTPEADFIPSEEDLAALAADPRPTLVILGGPNNPTGAVAPEGALRRLAAKRPDCLFVVDEAFADFDPDFASLTRDLPENCAVLLSLTKMFAIPGLRLGLLAGSEALCAKMRGLAPPWQVNALAQAVGERALRDAEHPRKTREALPRLRENLAQGLCALGLRVFPSRANYLLCRMEKGTAAGLNARLLERHGLALRDCANYRGLDARYFRMAVRNADENARFLEALRLELAPGRAPFSPARKKTPALMFQGTSSNAGKSLLAAALCRILRQDGFDVAPFKAQNMSLNSFVTAGGGEMGRAQVLQAQACRLSPDVRMNPVLLKPSSDVGSQVIVLGKPVGVMRVMEYVRYKPQAAAIARTAYDELAAEHEVMVIEGAGSPAEVNLKAHDMVNMAVAKYAGAKVLLVSDIDRGGSFAALLGTMECLSEAERALVCGYVLNRFRGDPTLLADAFDFMRQTTGREVLGVVPEIIDHGLPEEDSVSFKAAATLAKKPGAALDLALVDLPHISNFTDLDALSAEPDVSLRVVRRPSDLDRVPDAVILPGSKNTVADLAALREKGLADRLAALAASGETEIVGVCAGLQMLGREVQDPLGLETDRGGAEGLGLLPMVTELARDKTLLLAAATFAPTGERLSGYEIHHGETRVLAACQTVVRREDGKAIGFAAPGRRVWGSYLHGIFDADGFRRGWLNGLRARKGLAPLESTRSYDLEPALDRLADVVRQSLSMKKIRALLGL